MCLSLRRTETVVCGACKTSFLDKRNVATERRRPCPSCGSTGRLFFQTVATETTAQTSIGYKGRRSGKGKPFIIGKLGADWSARLRRFVHLERVVDRANDRYKEVVTDPTTGDVIHHCEEPLSQHQNHGSAKMPLARSRYNKSLDASGGSVFL